MASLRVNPLGTITIILWLTCSVSCQDPQAGLVEDVEALINRTLSCTSIQGLSISLVRNGQTVLAAGYGTRDNSYEPDDPLSRVTDTTKFCIGSITKTFTAVLLAHLLSDQSANRTNRVKWDTPVSDILGPDFQMSDWIRTNMTTIRDLMAHKAGLDDYMGSLLLGQDPLGPRQDFCRRLHQLEPVQGFRERFKYNNYMYTLLACIIERLSGASYEKLMRERLWRPLQMNNTVFTQIGMNWTDDFSKAFFKDKNTGNMSTFYEKIAEISPHEAAGAICTTPGDMARWMKFLLSRGRHIQPSLVDYSLFHSLWVPGNALSTHGFMRPRYPFSKTWTSYGLGFLIGHYRGYNAIGHDGGISGFTSEMLLLPEAGVGILLSSNTATSETILGLTVLISSALDRLTGLPVWVNETSVCSFLPAPHTRRPPPEESQSSQAADEHNSIETPDDESFEICIPETPLSQYVGQYGHRLFGNITIGYDENDTSNRCLNFRMGRLGTGTLDPVLGHAGYFNIIFDERLKAIVPFFEMKMIEFRNFHDGAYQELINYAYSSDVPPKFVRGVVW